MIIRVLLLAVCFVGLTPLLWQGGTRGGAGFAAEAADTDPPERVFLKQIVDAAKRNDAEELASMLHPDVIASFGKGKCVAALTRENTSARIIGGRPVRSGTASWKNAQGRTQISQGGPAFKAGVSMMEGTKITGLFTLDFAADAEGKFHLFVDCNKPVFKKTE